MDHNTLTTLFKLLGYDVHVLHDQTAQVCKAGKIDTCLRGLGCDLGSEASAGIYAPCVFTHSVVPLILQSSKKRCGVSRLFWC